LKVKKEPTVWQTSAFGLWKSIAPLIGVKVRCQPACRASRDHEVCRIRETFAHQVRDNVFPDSGASPVQGGVLVDLNRVVVARERSPVAVIHVDFVPIVHQRVLRLIRAEVPPTQLHGWCVRFRRTEAAFRPAKAIVKRLAPTTALVVDVPFVGTRTSSRGMVVRTRATIKANCPVRCRNKGSRGCRRCRSASHWLDKRTCVFGPGN